MPFMTRIPSDLARFGLRIELTPGWETRGSSSFAPGGVTCHWTAGPRGTAKRPSLNICINGRPGIPGPLCNIYLARDGTCVVVAAGRANHAGQGGFRGLVGNSAVYGIEAESAGDGDWTDAQRETYPRLVAALLWGLGRDASWAHGHHEWAPNRKIDVRDIIGSIRTGAATILANPAAATHLEEDMAQKDIDEMQRKLSLLLGVELTARDSRERTPGEQVLQGRVGYSVTDLTGGQQQTDAVLAEVFANTRALLARDLAQVDVAELAATLGPLLVSSATTLSDGDLARVAVAVADEQHRRSAS